MMITNNTIKIFGLFVLVTGLLAQLIGYTNTDTAWLVYATRRWLEGERLYVDFVESNPPLVIYLTAIPLYFSKFLNLADIDLFNIFIYLITLVSTYLSLKILANNYLKIALLISLYWTSAVIFTEREHLFVVMCLPYILSIIYQKDYSGITKVIVPIMAGIGFALKPYFILAFIAYSIYDAVLNKSFIRLFRIENLITGAVIGSYFIYLYFVDQTYISNVVPMMMRYYWAFAMPIQSTLIQTALEIFMFVVPGIIVFKKDGNFIDREYIGWFIGFVSCLAIVLIQHKGWSNHSYHMHVFGLFMNTVLVSKVFSQKGMWQNVEKFLVSIVLVAALITGSVAITKQILILGESKNIKRIALMNKYSANKITYSLSFNLDATFPELLYSDAKYKSRYAHLWMYPGLYYGASLQKNGEVVYNKPEKQSKDERAVFDNIINEIKTLKPALLVFTENDTKDIFGRDYKFSLISYLSQSPDFVQEFSKYKKVAKIEGEIFYARKGDNQVD